MLKKLIAFYCLCAISPFVNATSYLLTGVVDSISGPDVPYNIGDTLSFVVEVDLSSPGYIDSTGGGSVTYLGADYYEAQYIEGDAVPNVNWDGWVEYYYWDDTGSNRGQICVLNTLCFTADPEEGGVESWGSGTTVSFTQSWSYLDGSTPVQNHINGHLTNASAVDPVNVPFLPLWGLGILGVLFSLTKVMRKR